jgi:hypothetical protein
MLRTRVLFLSLVLSALLPGVAQGAIITQCADASPTCGIVGYFTWDALLEDSGTPDEPQLVQVGDLFTLFNVASDIGSPVSGMDPSQLTFSSVELVLNAAGTPVLLADVLVPSLADPGQSSHATFLDTDGTISSASIRFVFLGETFVAPFPAGTFPTSSFSAGGTFYEIRATAVPEPSTWLLLGVGLALRALTGRRTGN